MKSRITGSCKTASKLSESARRHITRFAIAAILAGVCFLALACPAAAEIVYTKVDVTLPVNGGYNLDLNHDGVTDLILTNSARGGYCGPFNAVVSEWPASGNGAEGSPPAALTEGDQIGPAQTYYAGQGTMAWEHWNGCEHSHDSGGGNWWDTTGLYLGLMFQINGETHYGWAQLNVKLRTTGPKPWDFVFAAVLTGYAYETVADAPINAGQGIDFTITTSPTSATVPPGQSTTSTLTLMPVAGFSGTVALTCKVPSGDGLSCEVSPSSVTLDGTDSATATLSLNTSSSTPAGTYKITAKGTYSAIAHSKTFKLTVQ